MSYEVDSKKTILITEDVFKMLPVVRTVSLPVIIIGVLCIFGVSNRAPLFDSSGRDPSPVVCTSSFPLSDLFFSLPLQWWRCGQGIIDHIVGRVATEHKLQPGLAAS